MGVGSSARTVESLVITELKGPAVFYVFNPWRANKKGPSVIFPEVFFLAAGELLAIMIGVSLVITLIVQPLSMQCYHGDVVIPGCNSTTLEDNALKRRIGYNNLCVYFDMPPAKYFACIVFMFTAYCGFRYSWLDMERTFLVRDRLSPCKFCFSIFTDCLYMLAWATFVLTYVIPPWENVWGHSAGFMFLGITTWFVLLANVLEGDSFPLIVYIFVVIYGIFTIVDFGGVAAANFIYYDMTDGKKDPLIPWWVGFCADYGWFGTLALTSMIMPKSEGLQRVTTIVDPEMIGKEEDEQNLWCGGEDDDSDDEGQQY